ncbi:serine/threonine-protein kinase/endoribonuclease IRE1a-like [Rhodamnia argentea]|uniref:Serine/threonine-protein kinase/endoribonuclease IRE1a-like n=1 Tax=Rhodamnia argentea TaxID=178133 RepID=A0A8B8QJT8_9MYRT|nr:serine/threonine-protein kinase/endoribonuclease IRE1a-like [Rhodamnia argentea]
MAHNSGEPDRRREEFSQDMGRLILQAVSRLRDTDLDNIGVDDAFVVEMLGIKLSKEIGKGKNGCAVYSGQIYDSTEVAVKRFVKGHIEVDSHIINFLSINPHPNVVCPVSGVKYNRYFGYIIQELCHFSLLDLIDALNPLCNFVVNPDDAQPMIDYKEKQKALRDTMRTRGIELWAHKAVGYPSDTVLKLMRDITSGLHYLHMHDMVHGNLRAENILIVDKNGVLSAKISDAGIAAVSGRATAPELYNAGQRPTTKSDMFCYASIIFFCLTGHHPFGDSIVRDKRTKKNKKDMTLLQRNYEASILLGDLLSTDPNLR